ncbi:MAG: hypothetical protein ACREUU_05360, partial [Gammaproteobacteria bacterium]
MTRSFTSRLISLAAAVALAATLARAGDDLVLYKFERQKLTDVYFSEGANAGDLNRDGHADV